MKTLEIDGLGNFRNNPAFYKLVQRFDCDITSICMNGSELNDKEKLKAINELFKRSTKLSKFSYYKAPISNTSPYSEINLKQIYNVIKGQYYKNRTNQLRAIKNCIEAREFKNKEFEYVTFSGRFSRRKVEDLIKQSGYICFDFDDINDLESTKANLKSDPYTQLLFTSPSGNGLKWIIKVKLSEGSHLEFFNGIKSYVKNKYDLAPDESAKDLSRACFVCYDPSAFINPEILK